MRQRKKLLKTFIENWKTKEGEKDIYKTAKLRDRNTRDLIEIKCIKDKNGPP